MLKLLVARGADVACKDKKGYTLLHTAAASGQIEVVKHLLRLGVEVRPVATLGGGRWGHELRGEAASGHTYVHAGHYQELWDPTEMPLYVRGMGTPISAAWRLLQMLYPPAQEPGESPCPGSDLLYPRALLHFLS